MSLDDPATGDSWFDGTVGLGVGVAVGGGLGLAIGSVTGDFSVWVATGVALGVVAVAGLRGDSSE